MIPTANKFPMHKELQMELRVRGVVSPTTLNRSNASVSGLKDLKKKYEKPTQL